jgi:hypothetical protein
VFNVDISGLDETTEHGARAELVEEIARYAHDGTLLLTVVGFDGEHPLSNPTQYSGEHPLLARELLELPPGQIGFASERVTGVQLNKLVGVGNWQLAQHERVQQRKCCGRRANGERKHEGRHGRESRGSPEGSGGVGDDSHRRHNCRSKSNGSVRGRVATSANVTVRA